MPTQQNFHTIPHKDIAKGIDKRSSPNNVQPGFAEDMRNMDTNSTGSVEKRKGYQAYKGSVPLRMEGVTLNGTNGDLAFNSEVNFLLVSESPVVVYGEILESGGALTITAVGTTVTGSVGTTFTTTMKVGSVIIASNGESQVVTSITSDTELEVGAAFNDVSALNYTYRTTNEYYWDTFINDSRKTVDAFTSKTLNVTHGSASFQVASGVVNAPTDDSLDNFTIIPEDITITTINELEVTIDNTLSSDARDFYLLTENNDDTNVVSYRTAISETITAGVATITITAATHSLPNLHIIPFVYANKSGSEQSLVIPDSFIVDSAGDVIITIEDAGITTGGATDFIGQVVLIDVPGDQSLEASFTSGDGKTLEFTGITSTFNFYSIFEQEPGGDQVQVIPDSIFFDANLGKVTVTFDIDTSRNIKLVYTNASVKSNVITVDLTNYPNIIDDSSPSVGMWGIPHTDIIYQNSVPKGSWTNSIEEYSSQGVNKLVVGLGGVLSEETQPNSGITLPSYFSDIRRRTASGKSIGPFFGPISGKVRGIESPSISSNRISISGFTNNGDATASATLDIGIRYGSLDDLVLDSSVIGDDRITISGSGISEYSGTFGINSVIDPSNHELATNHGISSVTKDSSSSVTFTFDSNAEAVSFHSTYLVDGDYWSWRDLADNIFLMSVADSSSLDPGLGTTITATTTNCTLVGTNLDFASAGSTTFSTEKMTNGTPDDVVSMTLSITGLASYVPNETDSGSNGIITTDFLIMSSLNESSVAEDLPFLVNDTIVSTLFSDAPVVVGVDPAIASTRTLFMNNITANLLVPAAASINASRTSNVQPLTDVEFIVKGDTVSVLGFEREFQVLSVDTANNTVTLDESILMSDSSSNRSTMTVTGRWKPIEAPALNDKPISYFDENGINNQDRLRGVSINDSIYYTNYNDDVMKYDGASLYRAGFPNWQPRTHSWVNRDEAGIPITEFQYLSAQASDNSLNFVELPDLIGIDEIYLNANGSITAGFYSIESVDNNNNKIILDTNIGSDESAGVMIIPRQAAYYFKLQMIDRNNNLVASATTDFQECIVNMTRSGTITHKLTGLPKFDVYDYDRVDLLVFRTKLALDATAPFFLVKRVPIDFELALATNSIRIRDNVPDESLSPIPDDTVSIALKGAELPLSSDQPPRSKYLATADNRLIMGNIKTYNRADVTLISDSGITEDNVLGNATVTLSDDDNSLTFEYIDFVDGAAALNSLNNVIIDDIDFSASETEFTIELNSSIAYSLTGKYIQLSSFYMDQTGTDLYTVDTRNANNDIGMLIGWWKVKSHTAASSTVVIEYTHDELGTYTFNSAGNGNNPVYMTFPDSGSDNIPILAIPYSISGNSFPIVENVIFDDTTTAFEFTNAINRGVRDLKQAFNRVMVEEESPWAYALSGPTEGNGRIIIESALPGKTVGVSITPDAGSDVEIFINNIRRISGSTVNGNTTLFPSRLLISSPNFPEMFDNPFGSSISDSDSLIDINANDGQEITGIVTFFADSTDANGHLQSTVLVFKNKSVYTVNVATRALQKLESMGQGCTIPDSISATQSGIMFANRSGIYKVDRNLRITYVGEWLERYWQDDVGSSTVIEAATAYTDSINRKYKLSVPIGSSTKNSEVAVIDYIVNQDIADGAWTLYDNIPASGWAQTNSNSYFGTYTGQVFALRQVGDETDYRDDATGISSSFTYGAQSFGDSGTRTVVNRVIGHFRSQTEVSGLTLDIASDMSITFESTDIIGYNVNDPKVATIASSVPQRHGLYFQIRYSHSTIDQNVIIAGIDFKVQTLGELGINQAKEST
jgi:hypothetical protein